MKPRPGTDAAAHEPLSVNMADAARLLGIGRRRLWSLVNQRLIPSFRNGARIMFSVASLREWIADQEREGGAR